MLDGDRIRQAKIVFRDDVRIDEGHGRTLKSAGLKTPPVRRLTLTECYQAIRGAVASVKRPFKKNCKTLG